VDRRQRKITKNKKEKTQKRKSKKCSRSQLMEVRRSGVEGRGYHSLRKANNSYQTMQRNP
jgi:hypothetical protein